MHKSLVLLALLTLPLFGEEEPNCQTPCNAGYYGCGSEEEAVPAEDCQQKEPCFSACECHAGPAIGIASIRHRAPGGIGYNEGYTSADLFYLLDSGNFFPFIDIRAHVFNDGKPAYNVGGGLRYLSECSDFAMGLNLYYDYRDAEHTNFHALGMGAEFLWPGWALTVNGYAPVNRHKRSYETGFSGFRGNRAHFYKKYETAMSGADINLKWELFRYLPVTECPHGDGSIVGDVIFGGYYFVGDYGETAAGGLFKFRLTASRRFFAEGQVSYDNQFNWRGQGEVGLRFTFGPPVTRTDRLISECVDLIALEEKLADRPERFEMIVTTTHKKRGRARNPLTGLAQNFIFVSPNGSSDGSFESPFATLSEALAICGPGDAIYLLAGDGTAIQPSGELVMQQSQSLLGSGTSHIIDTSFGRGILPAQSEHMPIVLTGAANKYLTLESNNTVAGIDLRVDELVTFLIGGVGIENCNILYNNISTVNGGSVVKEIITADYHGRLRVVGNTITGFSPNVGVLIVTNVDEVGRAEIFGNMTDMSTASQYEVVQSGSTQTFFENNTSLGSQLFTLENFNQPSSLIIRHNDYVSDDATKFGYVIDNSGGTLEAVVEGNQSVVDPTAGLADLDITGLGMNAKLAKNQGSEFVGPMFLRGPLDSVQSPNLELSGLEVINNGFAEVLEPVTFISFE